MFHDPPCRSEGEGVSHKCAGEEGHADFREAVVAIIPCAAVEGIHVFFFTSENPNGHSAADDLAVGGHVCLDSEVGLSTAGRAAETGHDFVKYQGRAGLCGDGPHFMHEFPWLQSWRAALDRLDHHGGELVGVGLEDLQRGGIGIVKHQHVFHQGLGNPRGDGLRFIHAIHPGSTDQHFFKHAVVIAGKIGDPVATCDRSGKSHGGHDGFRAGITECSALHAGELTDRLGELSGDE